MKKAGQRRKPSVSKAEKGSPKSEGTDRGERLQKVLAAAGVGSRRQCEELITTGRVEVDGKVVTKLGTKVDPTRQKIRVDGVPVKQPRRVYYMVNKPDGVVCTTRDPSGRPRVIDMVPADRHRLYTIGRLDLHSEGLILVTNDGELTQRLTHPRFGVPKTYVVQVAGTPDREVLAKLKRGIHLAEGVARASRVRVRKRHKQSTILELELCEGKNREIRRMLARIGHKVMRLKRIAVGPVRLGRLAVGHWRPLSAEEIAALRAAAGLTRPQNQKSDKKTTASQSSKKRS
ncbi:MAG: rRNA pseudouridine synthase [Planctomycetota bacterium]|nr:MAG: rRNA pseudouridine synthase [Planctomycetota bacterium]